MGPTADTRSDALVATAHGVKLSLRLFTGGLKMHKAIGAALLLATTAIFVGTAPGSMTEPAPTGSRCIDVKPICVSG